MRKASLSFRHFPHAPPRRTMWIGHSRGIRTAREHLYIHAMIVDGAQVRAGRAMLGWRQQELAAAAKVHWNTVATIEKQGRLTPEKRERCDMALSRLEAALRKAGVIILAEPSPGVFLAV